MKLDHETTAHICRGLSLLLHAGLSLADGIFLLAQEERGEVRTLLETLGSAMDRGDALYTAMEDCGAFPEAAVGMVRIGENTGRTEETLSYLAEFYDERVRTARQIKNALAYPSLILVLMMGVLAVLLVEVLPVFDAVYASLGSRLTGVAEGLLYLGVLLEKALPWLAGVLGVALAAFLAYKFCLPFREKVSGAFLRKFGDKGIARRFNNAQFARAMAMGLGSGLTLEESLELSRKLLAHIPGAAARCGQCRDAVNAGEDLSAALNAAALLPQSQSRMLSLGLRGGSGDRVMEDIANRLSDDAREGLEEAVSKIEPALVLVCSVLVGLVLLSVMLPLMNILSVIG